MIFIDLRSLRYMPCGCAADLETMDGPRFGILVCPWCGAEFEYADFIRYQRDCQLPLIRQPAFLVTDGDDVLEVVGQSNCGHAVVRKRGFGAKPEHCAKPLNVLKD